MLPSPEEAESTDVIAPTAGDDVYLEPDAADDLDDMELDATVEGDQVTFTVQERSPNGKA